MKYSLVDTPGDGNCFYSCIKILVDTPLTRNMYAVRNKGALYFLQKIAHYRPFLTNSVERETCRFLKNNSWAHTIQIECVAYALNLCIDVYRVSVEPKLPKEFSLKRLETVKHVKHTFNTGGKKRIKILHVNDNHFMALRSN